MTPQLPRDQVTDLEATPVMRITMPKPLNFTILVTTAFFLMTACKDSEPLPQASLSPAAVNDLVPAQANAGKIDPETTGSIQITVRFLGGVPDRKPEPISSEASCLAHWNGNPPLAQSILLQNGLVQNAFAYIKQGLKDYDYPPADGPAKLDQIGCLYTPRVIGVRTGQPIEFMNSDALLHNVHTVAKSNVAFNIAQPFKGKVDIKTFARPEVMVKTKCDIHPWMAAYIGVMDNPFFGVTSEQGVTSLTGVPAGEYVVETWHEVFGTKAATVKVDPKLTTPVEITYPTDGK